MLPMEVGSDFEWLQVTVHALHGCILWGLATSSCLQKRDINREEE